MHERGFRQAKCHVVAQTQGYHRVCIWGRLVKFQGGGVVLKTMLCAALIPVFQSSVSPSNLGGVVFSWVSCCCTETGLSSGMNLR